MSQITGEGHTLYVATGTYDTDLGEIFPIYIKNGVSLIGAGAESCELDAKNSDIVLKCISIVNPETRISGFTIENGKSLKVDGGGIYISAGSQLLVKNNSIMDNEGGGIYIKSSSPRIEKNVISSNDGYRDDCRASAINISDSSSKPVIIDNIISGNRNFFHAGGWTGIAGPVVINNASGTVFKGNLVTQNSVLYDSPSGAISIMNCSPKVSNNIIVNNEKLKGVYIGGASAFPTIVNNTISDNDGDGIYLSSAKSDSIINNIISFNDGYGINELTSSSDPEKVWYNLFYVNTLGIYFDEHNLSYYIVNSMDSEVPECENNIEGDPLFVDRVNGDYHLRDGSPGIDAGDPGFDYSHEPQPNGGKINIGAYGNTPEATSGSPDSIGPKTSNVSVSPNPTSGASSITLNALISDVGYGNSVINETEYFIDSIDSNGTGTFLLASDGAFDEPTEDVQTTIEITSWQVGSSHKIYVHGKDIHNNWGDFDSVNVLVTSSVTRELSFPNKSAAPGDTVVIPILVKDATGIAGAEIKLTYDSNILTALEASTTTLTKDFTIADSIMTGKIAITMACSTGLPGGNGEFVNIKFQVSANANIGATSPLHFEIVELYDENTNLIPVATQDGIFTVSPETIKIERIFIQPSSDTLNISDTKEFSAFAKKSDSSEISVSVNWVLEKKFGNIGSINPGSGEKTTFTATGTGDGLIRATYNETLTAAAVLVVGKLKGDINIDDKVNVQDAIRCLQIIVNNYTPSLYQLWAADFDGSGGWPDEGDALGILKESLNGLLPKVLVYKTSGPATVKMGSFIYESNDIITVPILIDGRDDVFASGFEIQYNSQVLRALAATSSMPSSYIATNFNEPGTAKFSLINTHGLVNSEGEIIKLKFKINGKQDGNPELNIKAVRLFDRQAQRIEANVNLHQETITALPKAYELHQNYPNPFNPTTTIRYSLPEASDIKLTIYNMTGQEIKRLATGKVAAGSHSIVWNARDNAGNAVPSGVYFFKLSVESQQWQRMKKMVLIK